MSVPKIERLIGIEAYGTNSYGIGGIIRFFPKDFVVNEVLVDGSKANKNQMQRGALGSSKIKTRYLMCVFVKKNWDTFLALKKVTKRLGINSKKLRIAGIKDAKAITSQFVTIEEAVPEAVKKIQIKDLQIFPIGYVREKVSSYYLLGNQFQINIRGINYQKQTIRKRVLKTIEEVEEKGLPNFFGHQRFGTITILRRSFDSESLFYTVRCVDVPFGDRTSPQFYPFVGDFYEPILYRAEISLTPE